MEALIKRKDAAKILGISVSKLDYERMSGKIAFIQYVENGCVYFTEKALRDYTERATRKADPVNTRLTNRRFRRTGRS
ncbi:MAG: DNA-binding protein [Lachnospiraceae bacterium]|nr:DNA-binding protein [Lachnospiraceae bacterium]HAE45512.1 DNA-binding protein [Lachnospiraceae bacterium]